MLLRLVVRLLFTFLLLKMRLFLFTFLLTDLSEVSVVHILEVSFSSDQETFLLLRLVKFC